MAISPKLELRQSQALVMTPQLQQAIKLLPMTTLELMDKLNQEVVENPLLEEVTTEELQQAESETQIERSDSESETLSEKQDTWDDADYEYFFGEYHENKCQ